MNSYHKAQTLIVKPDGTTFEWPVNMQIRSEYGVTKWLNVPSDKVDQLLALVVSFSEQPTA